MPDEQVMFWYLQDLAKEGNINLRSAAYALRNHFDVPPRRAEEIVVRWYKKSAGAIPIEKV